MGKFDHQHRTAGCSRREQQSVIPILAERSATRGRTDGVAVHFTIWGPAMILITGAEGGWTTLLTAMWNEFQGDAGWPLPERVQQALSPLFDFDFSRVRIHFGPQ